VPFRKDSTRNFTKSSGESIPLKRFHGLLSSHSLNSFSDLSKVDCSKIHALLAFEVRLLREVAGENADEGDDHGSGNAGGEPRRRYGLHAASGLKYGHVTRPAQISRPVAVGDGESVKIEPSQSARESTSCNRGQNDTDAGGNVL